MFLKELGIFSPKIESLMGRTSNTSSVKRKAMSSTDKTKEPTPTKAELEMIKQKRDYEDLKASLKYFMKEIRFPNDPYFRDYSRMRSFDDPEREFFERQMEPVTLMAESLFTDFSIEDRMIPDEIQGSSLSSLCEKHNFILKEVLSAISILNEVRDEIREECLKQYDWLNEAILENDLGASDNIALIKFLAETKKDF
jgi:hypothetical protein